MCMSVLVLLEAYMACGRPVVNVPMKMFMDWAVEHIIMPRTMNDAPKCLVNSQPQLISSECLTNKGDVSTSEQVRHGPDEGAHGGERQEVSEDEPYPPVCTAELSVDVGRCLRQER